MRFTGGGTRFWSPISGVKVVVVGSTSHGLIVRSTDVLRRKFCNTSASSKDSDRWASTIMMYNVDVGSLLGTTGTTVGLRIRVSRCGGSRLRADSWTGGLRTFWQEGFDQVLGAIRSGRGGSRVFVPLESLIGNEGGLVNRIGARAAPDFVVLATSEAACNDYPDNCTKNETTNT